MNGEFIIPSLGKAPNEYDPKFIDNLIRQVTATFRIIQSNGKITGSTLLVDSLPTSSVGLRAGEVWNDAGTLKVV